MCIININKQKKTKKKEELTEETKKKNTLNSDLQEKKLLVFNFNIVDNEFVLDENLLYSKDLVTVQRNFLGETKNLLKKYDIYWDENVEFGTFECVFEKIKENHFFTIVRKVEADKLVISWKSEKDLYLVLNILFCCYLLSSDSQNPCDVVINSIKYTEISEHMLNNIVNNNIKSIDVIFTGTTEEQKITYEYELQSVFFIYIKNNSELTKKLANMEWNRLNMQKYFNWIQ